MAAVSRRPWRTWLRLLGSILTPPVLLYFLVSWGLRWWRRRTLPKCPERPPQHWTIATQRTLLWNPSQDVTSPNVAFREGVLPVLSALLERLNATRSTLTLLSHVSSDAEESQIKHLFLKSGLYSKGLDPRRVLFCDSGEGLTHMVRHLSPGVHVDSVGSVSQKRMEDLQMFVPTLVCVDRRHPGRTESSSSTEMSPTPSASSPPRILSLDSFDQILQLNTL